MVVASEAPPTVSNVLAHGTCVPHTDPSAERQVGICCKPLHYATPGAIHDEETRMPKPPYCVRGPAAMVCAVCCVVWLLRGNMSRDY